MTSTGVPANTAAAGPGHLHQHDRRKSHMSKMSMMAKSEEEMGRAMHDFAEKDSYGDRTWTRLFVESYLSKWTLYNPNRDKEGAPSLSEAYAFYEHVTLPRHFVGTDDRAEPGESNEPTLLYDPFRTQATSFSEWGTGMDLYFSTLKMVAAMLFVAGLLNVYNMWYFASPLYSDDQQAKIGNIFLKGSALCTDSEWVVCSDCLPEDFDQDISEKRRFGISVNGTVLVQRNSCNGADLVQGVVNYATFIFILGSMIFMSVYLRAREVRSDEDELTATDYSVVVRNPPPKAFDPDEWKEFFQQFAAKQVTCVTVALDNDDLLRKLTERRAKQNSLRLLLPHGTDMDDRDQVRQAVEALTEQLEAQSSCATKLLELIGMAVPPQAIYNNIEKLADEIRELQKREYNVSSVFVTFETEEGQRNALKHFSVGMLNVWMNTTSRVDPKIVFQGRVLDVDEPVEPDSVRWLDLSSTMFGRWLMRIFSLVVTVVSLVISGIIVFFIRERYGPYLAGLLVSVFNSIIPEIVAVLMNHEQHLSQGSYQTSLYLKITLFRWINTAVLTQMITPLTGTLDAGEDEVIPSICAILVSELYATPLLKLMDISSNMNKHLYAPRATTQEQMNSYFHGTSYNIGERYTGLTNIMFVCFFYSSLFPGAFFFGAAILLIQHYTDKFCLMRIWSRQPTVGSQLARFSRRYFFYGSLVTMVVVSAYSWAQYPYDNLCDPVKNPSYNHAGEYYSVELLDGTFVANISVAQDEAVRYCSQSPLDADSFPFPPTSRLEPDDLKFMSDIQRMMSDYYGWTAFAAVVAYVVLAFGSHVLGVLLSFFVGTYAPSGASQNIDFSSNAEIFSYIPQIKVVGAAFPLLACDVDDIDEGLIGWTDKSKSYDYHNMMFDVPHEGIKRTRSHGDNQESSEPPDGIDPSESTALLTKANPIYSIVKHYPPPWLQKMRDAAKDIKEEKKEEEEAPPGADENGPSDNAGMLSPSNSGVSSSGSLSPANVIQSAKKLFLGRAD